MISSSINGILHKLGAQVTRYPGGCVQRRIKLINYFGINKILDVGANSGQFALEMRSIGFKGKIISFEPLSIVFRELVKNSRHDESWTAVNCALGDADAEAVINVAGNINSSSLLSMHQNHEKSSPGSKFIGKENILIKKLDSIFHDYYEENDSVYLKLDTQGFEKRALDGAERSLKYIKGIQIEMSLVPLYEGSLLFPEMKQFLESQGYELYSLESGFTDPESGRLLQVDGIFFRN